MTTQINQLTELTVTSDDDLILIREDSTGVDKRMRAQNIRAKATTKGDVGLGNVPNLDTTNAVNKAHDQNTDTALAQGTASAVTASEARSHIDATNNPHNVTKAQVGLGSVDNVSAADLRDRSTHTGTQAGTTVTYDNTASGLVSENVQAAIDELEARPSVEDADQINYDNAVSGLAATDVQAAIDEVQNGLGTAAAADVGDFATSTQGSLADTAVQPGDIGTIASQDADDVAITGGTVNATNLQQSGSQAYVRDNILGTVSESSGVPTGAIIERGSNANGEFVKYADGTMICLSQVIMLSAAGAVGSWFRGAFAERKTWTFPAEFINSSSIRAYGAKSNASGSGTFYGDVVGENMASSSLQVRGVSPQEVNDETLPCSFVAIGRWY